MPELEVAAAAASVIALSNQLDHKARDEVRKAAASARAFAASHAPGRAGRTLRLRQAGPFEWRIESGWKKLGLLEYGTRRHMIEPKRGRVLRFIANGSVVFAREVQHPGTKAYKFMQRGRATGERKLHVFASGSLV